MVNNMQAKAFNQFRQFTEAKFNKSESAHRILFISTNLQNKFALTQAFHKLYKNVT